MPKEPTRTLSVIRAAADRPDEVIVAGEVAEIRFPKGGSLSLLASKLFVQLLDLAGADVAEERTHRATMRSLNWSHRELEELEEAIHELHATTVSLNSETASFSGSVLAEALRPKNAAQGELEWRFSRPFQQVVKNSRHWAAISARAVLAMDCKYSPWLYQLCALHAGRGRVSEDWDLADLRERLGASAPTWRRWQDFKRRVLEPACAEINQLTGVGVAWEPIKYGPQGYGRAALDLAQGRNRDRRGRRRACPPPGRAARNGEAIWSSGSSRSAPPGAARPRPSWPSCATGRRKSHPQRPSADPRQIDLEEAIAVAGVRLTAAQLMLGAEAARAEGAAQFDVQAAYADWLRAAAQRKDRLRNPAGHWIDFCKRRAQELKEEGD